MSTPAPDNGQAVPSIATLWTSTRTNGTIAHLVAAQSGLAITPRFISLRGGDHKTTDYLSVNPKGEIPALQLASGTVITETPAILVWIADQAPGAGLLPLEHPARAKALEWLAWCHFQTARTFSMAFGAVRMCGGDEAAGAALKAASLQRARTALAYANSQIKGDCTLLGTGIPGAADIFLSAMTGFAAMLKIDVTDLTRLASAAKLVQSQPAIAAALALEAAAG